MNRVLLNENTVDAFVTEQNARGNEVYWHGWSLVFWKENENGFYDKNGLFRNNTWGVKSVVSPDSDGLWRVHNKNVNSRRPRN